MCQAAGSAAGAVLMRDPDERSETDRLDHSTSHVLAARPPPAAQQDPRACERLRAVHRMCGDVVSGSTRAAAEAREAAKGGTKRRALPPAAGGPEARLLSRKRIVAFGPESISAAVDTGTATVDTDSPCEVCILLPRDTAGKHRARGVEGGLTANKEDLVPSTGAPGTWLAMLQN